MSALDKQEGGDHYKKLAIQPIEFTIKNGLDFIQGNIIKYATRHKDKNGPEDLKKVIHYAELGLELQYGMYRPSPEELEELYKSRPGRTFSKDRTVGASPELAAPYSQKDILDMCKQAVPEERRDSIMKKIADEPMTEMEREIDRQVEEAFQLTIKSPTVFRGVLKRIMEGDLSYFEENINEVVTNSTRNDPYQTELLDIRFKDEHH